MSLTWRQVKSSQKFKDSDPSTREAMRRQFFDEYVAPRAKAQNQDAARAQFDLETAPDTGLTKPGQMPADGPDLTPKTQPEPSWLATLANAGASVGVGAADSVAGGLKDLGLYQKGVGRDYKELSRYQDIDHNDDAWYDKLWPGEYLNLSAAPSKMLSRGIDWNAVKYRMAGPEQRQKIEADLKKRLKAAGDPTDTALYHAGSALSAAAHKNLPLDPALKDSFLYTKLPSGIGSTLPFAAASLATRRPLMGAGLSETAAGLAPAGALGAGVNRGQQFSQALQDGASFEQAFAARDAGTVSGLSEGLPIGRILDRIDAKGAIKKRLISALKSGTEEGLQEAGQNIWDNIAAKFNYDPKRGVFDGAGSGGAVGFGVGATLQAVGDLVLGRRARHMSEQDLKDYLGADQEKTEPSASGQDSSQASGAHDPIIEKTLRGETPSETEQQALVDAGLAKRNSDGGVSPLPAMRRRAKTILDGQATTPDAATDAKPSDAAQRADDTPATGQPAGPQPWQQTRAAFHADPANNGIDHEAAVEDALAAGQDVPLTVLTDYPDLIEARAGQDQAGKPRPTDNQANADEPAAPDAAKKTADMSEAELRDALRTDAQTGIPNRRAFVEDDDSPVVGIADLDGLKFVNDTFGHEAGDQLLTAAAAALHNTSGGRAYRFHGDEFGLRADSHDSARKVLDQANAELGGAKLTFTRPDGTTETHSGFGFSYGTGQDLSEADAKLGGHKEARTQSGHRSERGQAPGHSLGETAAGHDRAPEAGQRPDDQDRDQVDPHQAAEAGVYEQPLADLTYSDKVLPQFKKGADNKGITEPLQGTFDRTGVAPIQVWEDINGKRYIATGRHRADLANRSGETTIPAQLHREADGFTKQHAAMLDAELNIRDEQGSINDYATYFKNTGLTKQQAKSRGLLSRHKGRAGFSIAQSASDPLFAAHRAGAITDQAAQQLAEAAPNDERLQSVGLDALNKGASIADAANTMRAVSTLQTQTAEQGDIFGFDASGMAQAKAMAKIASAKQRAIRERISSVKGAAKRPEQARELGVDVKDPAAVKREIARLEGEAARWDNWHTDAGLVDQIRGQMRDNGATGESASKNTQSQTQGAPAPAADDGNRQESLDSSKPPASNKPDSAEAPSDTQYQVGQWIKRIVFSHGGGINNVYIDHIDDQGQYHLRGPGEDGPNKPTLSESELDQAIERGKPRGLPGAAKPDAADAPKQGKKPKPKPAAKPQSAADNTPAPKAPKPDAQIADEQKLIELRQRLRNNGQHLVASSGRAYKTRKAAENARKQLPEAGEFARDEWEVAGEPGNFRLQRKAEPSARNQEQARFDALNERADAIDNEGARNAQAQFENGDIDADGFERALDAAEQGASPDAFDTGKPDATQTLDAADRPENFNLAPPTRSDAQTEAEAQAAFNADQNDMFGGATQAAQDDRPQADSQPDAGAGGGLFAQGNAPTDAQTPDSAPDIESLTAAVSHAETLVRGAMRSGSPQLKTYQQQLQDARKALADAQDTKQVQDDDNAPAVPQFESSDQVRDWIAQRARARGMTKTAFYGTDEYAGAWPSIKAVFDREKADRSGRMSTRLADAGLQNGDAVQMTSQGMILGAEQTYTGTVQMRSGQPWVAVDGDGMTVNRGGKVTRAKRVRWDERWQAADAATSTPPASSGVADDRQLKKKRQVRAVGQQAAHDGDERTPPAYLGDELGNEWLVGYGEGLAEQAKASAAEPAGESSESSNPTRPADYGQANKVFTEDAAAKARARLKAKLGRANTGFDPEMLQDGLTLAGYHIEAGARSFAAYARAMVDDLGEGVRPYLKSFYNGVRDFPGFDAAGMDGYEAVRAMDADTIAATDTTDAADTAEQRPAFDLDTDTPAQFTIMHATERALGNGDALPSNRNAMKRWVAEQYDGVAARDIDNTQLKRAQEQIEAGIVAHLRGAYRDMQGTPERVQFAEFVDVYENQPALNIRTSTSVANQAYSTPAPLAWLAGKMSGALDTRGRVLEPTAGTGILALGKAPGSNVTLNEINDYRANLLRAAGYAVTQDDATTADFNGDYDVVIANPPFGSLYKATGQKEVRFDGFKLNKIDHVIAANALETLADDGQATLIVGASKNPGTRAEADRIFQNWLYSHYHVVDHYELDGELYGGQGAAWPVAVISVRGRGQSTLYAPEESAIPRYGSWDEAFDHYEHARQNNAPSLDTGDRAPGGRRPGARGDGRQGPAGNAGSASGAATAETDRSGARGGRGPGQRSGDADAGQSGSATTGQRGGSGGQSGQSSGNGSAATGDRLGGQSGKNTAAGSRGAAQGADTGGRTGANDADDGGLDASDFQVSYQPKSGGSGDGILIPRNLAGPTERALDELEARVGPLADYVMDRLGYGSRADLDAAFMGIQVDAIAAAIDNIEAGKGVVIADQTGVGKGRQAAAVLRYARKQGLTPVFITEKADLFTAMYDDMGDIGAGDFQPYLMNGDSYIEQSKKRLFAMKPAKRADGITRMTGGRMPAGADAIFATYSQFRVENKQRAAMMGIANNAVIVMDESHNAAGNSQTGEFLRDMLTAARGVTYLSATYAKRPDSMPLYHKTDLGAAVDDIDTLIEAMEAGGVPLQTVVSNTLAQSGQLFRRERSYAGVEIATEVDSANRARHEQISNGVTEGLRAILEADRLFHKLQVKAMDKAAKASAKKVSGAGNKASAGVSHTGFTSVVHNVIGQMLLATKANTAADSAIAAIKAGRKPIIGLENTFGSFLDQFAADAGIVNGEPLAGYDFRAILQRSLDRSRRVTYKLPNGNTQTQDVPLSELEPVIRQAYERAQGVIDGIDASILDDLTASPIDWIRHRIEAAGYRVKEITGRSQRVDYGHAQGATLANIDAAEKNKVATRNEFNGGQLDALVINVSGATGISLHASENFADQRQRHMIIAQAPRDINVFIQMLGRIHRTGQVALPRYSILTLDLPAEKRPTAVLARKMKSLNANTTANDESETSVEAPDILNKYGDGIVSDYLRENLDVSVFLDVALGEAGGGAPEGLAMQATGRLALMSIAEQRAFYAEVEPNYAALIEYLDKTGQNDLKAQILDLDAIAPADPITIVEGSDPSTQFGQDSKLGLYDIKAQGDPPSWADVQRAVRNALSGETPAHYVQSILEAKEPAFARVLARGNTRLEDVRLELAAATDAKKKAGLQEQERSIVETLSGLEQGYKRHRGAIERLHPGAVVGVAIEGEPYTGVVTRLKNLAENGRGNPYAFSKTQITLMLDSGMRSLTLPMTRVLGDDAVVHFNRQSTIDPETAFDNAANRNERESRWIATGNLLSAMGEIKKGQIATFTTHDGKDAQGIYLPKNFDPEFALPGDKLMRSPHGIYLMLNENQRTNDAIKRFGVATRDGADGARVLPQPDGIVIQVPSSKAKGAKYFLNSNLLEHTGDFVSIGNRMEAKVSGMQNSVDALRALAAIKPLYAPESVSKLASHYKERLGNVDDKGMDTGGVDEDTRYSRGGARPAGGLNVAGLRASLRNQFGPGIARMEANGTLTLVDSDAGLPARLQGRGARGVVLAGEGRVYLVADRLTPDNVKGVFLHEVGVHYGLADMLGEDAFADVLGRMAVLRRSGNPRVAAAYGRLPKATPAHLRDEEALGHLVENAPDLPLVKRVIAALRAFMFRTFGINRKRLSDADLVALARASAKRSVRGAGQTPAAGARRTPAFSDDRASAEDKAKLAALQSMAPIVVGDQGLATGPIKAARERARELYRRLQKIPAKTQDGRVVRFGNAGFRDTARHAADRRVLEIVPHLRAAVARAVPLWSEPPDKAVADNIRAFHHYGVKVRFPGGDAYVRLVIREQTDGTFYYDNYATDVADIEKAPADASLQLPRSQSRSDTTAARPDSKLARWIAAVNSASGANRYSRVADEGDAEARAGNDTGAATTRELGRFYDYHGRPIADDRIGKGNLTRYPITRAEADTLGRVNGVGRFATRGPDTTGEQGWFVDPDAAQNDSLVANNAERGQIVGRAQQREAVVFVPRLDAHGRSRFAYRVEASGRQPTPRTRWDEPLFSRLEATADDASAEDIAAIPTAEGQPRKPAAPAKTPARDNAKPGEMRLVARDANGVTRAAATVAHGQWIVVSKTSDLLGHAVTRAATRADAEQIMGGAGITVSLDAPSVDPPAQGEIPVNDLDIEPGSAMRQRARTIQYEFQDKLNSLLRIERAGAAQQGALADNESTYDRESLHSGRNSERTRQFQDEQLQPMLDALQKSGIGFKTAADYMADMDVDADVLERFGDMPVAELYLYARHAPRANAKLEEINPGQFDLSGMSNEHAAQIMAALKSDRNAEAFADFTARIDDITAATRQSLADDGIESQATVDAWAAKYPHYIPLKSADDAGGATPMPSRGQGFSQRGGASKRRLGRTTPAANILANVVAARQTAIERGEKNRVAQALLKFAQGHINSNLWTVNQPRRRRRLDPVTDTVQTFYDPNPGTADNVFIARVNGVEHHIVFNDKNVDTKRIAKAMNNLSAPVANRAVKFGLFANRLLAATRTSLSPVFLLTNFARDLQTAAINLNGTAAEDMKAKIIGDTIKLKGYRAIRAHQKNDLKNEWARYAREFHEAGAAVGWNQGYGSVEDLTKTLKARLEHQAPGSWAFAKRATRNVRDFISDRNAAVENGVRLSAYVHARKAGVSTDKAAVLAKNLTVNFNRRGNIGNELNAAYLFYGASVQGNARIFQAAMTSPRARRAMVATIGLGMAMDMINRLMAGDDDDGENYYDAIPEYIKQMNWIIMLPKGERVPDWVPYWAKGGEGRYLKFPMPYGYNMLAYTGAKLGRAADALTGRVKDYDPAEEAMNMGIGFVSAFNPIGYSAGLAQTFAPSLTKPFVEWWTNKNWNGMPLHPTANPYDTAPPPNYTLHYKGASAWSKWLAKFANMHSGGTQVTPGYINVSPEGIDHVTDFLTGSLGSLVSDVVDIGAKGVDAARTGDLSAATDNIPSYEVPFLSKFYGTPYEGASRSLFYDRRTELAYLKNEYEAARENGDRARIDTLRHDYPDKSRVLGLYKATENTLARARKIENALESSKLPAAEKRRRLKENQQVESRAYHRFNQRYRAVVIEGKR